MRKYLVLLMAAMLPMFTLQAHGQKLKTNLQKVVFSCDLHCQGCCDNVMKNIAWEKGVKDLRCDLPTKTVTVTYDPKKTDLETLLKAFEKIGKPAKVTDEGANGQRATGRKAEATEKTDANTGASTLQ